MGGKVGTGYVTERRKTNERSRDWENRGLDEVSEERKSQVAPSGICDDNNVAWFKSDFGDEIIVPGNSVNQGSRERVCGGEGSGRRESVFEGE